MEEDLDDIDHAAKLPPRAGVTAAQEFGQTAEGAIEVTAGVVLREGRVLITRRRPQDHLGGFWEFPGGKRHPGETYEECLKRELLEELGIEVEVGELLEAITHQYPEKSVHLRFFRCRWQRGEPQALGCAGFAWVPASELGSYRFPAADERLLKKLLNSTGIWDD